MKNGLAKKTGIWILAISLFMTHVFFRSVVHAENISGWSQIYSKTGDCSIAFPSPPQIVEQVMDLSDGKKLFYDMYLAPLQDKGVCLLLIATYPAALAPGFEAASIEGLIRGIVKHHPENELVFAEKAQIKGFSGMNFLVQSGSNYFRGQAVMVGNKLFLIAMEGKRDAREENTFLRFVKSFQFTK